MYNKVRSWFRKKDAQEPVRQLAVENDVAVARQPDEPYDPGLVQRVRDFQDTVFRLGGELSESISAADFDRAKSLVESFFELSRGTGRRDQRCLLSYLEQCYARDAAVSRVMTTMHRELVNLHQMVDETIATYRTYGLGIRNVEHFAEKVDMLMAWHGDRVKRERETLHPLYQPFPGVPCPVVNCACHAHGAAGTG